MNVHYINHYVVFQEFGITKITNKTNYNAQIRNASQVLRFDGTVDEAIRYVKKYFIGEK